MIYFIYGKDDFRSEMHLKTIVEFYKKSNPYSFSFDFADKFYSLPTIGEIKNLINGRTLFTSQKLIVLKNLISSCDVSYQQEFLEILQQGNIAFDKSIMVVIYENGEVKGELCEWLKRNTKWVKEFCLLDNKEVISWVKRIEGEFKINLTESARLLIVSAFGADTRNIFNVLEKLSLLDRKYIDEETLEENVFLPLNVNIFNLLDSLSEANISQGYNLLEKELINDVNPLYILTMIVNQFRNLIKIKASLVSGERGKKEDAKNTKNKLTAKSLGLHPFVLKKLLPIASHYSWNSLKQIYQRLLFYDKNIKGGLLDAKLSLELLLLDLKNSERN